MWSQVGFTKHHYKARGGDGIPAELLQILKDDNVKVLHPTGQQIWKTQQWPQDWKRSVFTAIPKGKPFCVQTTAQLQWLHILARSCSKSFKLGFNSTRTKNFQTYKLDLEKAEEPEIKFPTSTGSQKKQGNFRKTATSASLIMLKLLTVWITATCGKFLKGWENQTTLPASCETCMRVKKQQLEPTEHGKTNWFQTGKGVRQGRILLPCLFNLYADYIMQNTGLDEAQTGIKTSRRNINNLIYVRG